MMRIALLSLLLTLLVACGGADPAKDAESGHGEAAAAAEFERGPHRGRMLRDGEFAIEVTIFETGVPPQFRLYAYQGDKPLPPASVRPTIQLKRLDGETNTFTFNPEGDYLTGSGTVTEPHSFDVVVEAEHGGKRHRWTYDSYEGRTMIPAAIAKDAGVQAAVAGPAVIRNTVALVGTIALDANRHVEVKARFPGIVRAVSVQQGQRVRRGQTLVLVEGNESMRTYPVTAPFDGVVLARHTNIGDVADGNALVELADMSDVWVELRAIGTDADRLTPGQEVAITSATGENKAYGKIDTLLPVASFGQSVSILP